LAATLVTTDIAQTDLKFAILMQPGKVRQTGAIDHNKKIQLNSIRRTGLGKLSAPYAETACPGPAISPVDGSNVRNAG
jgi:hypothetical protein